ncbi:MAG TPA: ATPase domain-containing protein [Armatimonadota bacterium]|nr:ATPase domain-containing protein [Armatimonadota bacterium]
MEKIPTGIEGLDLILMGGIVRGHAILVEGTPGAGKTTVGIQFIHEGVVRYGEAGLIISFEQFPAQLYRDAANFGWDLRALEAQNKVRVCCTSPEVLRDQLQKPDGLIDEWIQEMGARRILIDSISHLDTLSADPMERRVLAVSLLNALKQRGLTVLVTKEVTSEEGYGCSFEEYVVDAVIRVSNTADRETGRRQRHVEVLKSRGQDHISGRHYFRFGPEGIEVFPLQVVPTRQAVPGEAALLPTGVAGLDHLLDGGLRQASSLLLSGESGTGKTILGLQFLQEGASLGEKGLLFLYQETPEQVQQVAASFGWDLAHLEAEGLLTVVYAPFAELSLAEHLWVVRVQLQETGARRVVFDSLSAMLHEVSQQPHMAKERTDQLVRLTKGLGAAAIFIAEVPAGSSRISTYGVEESLVDSVVLLRSTRDGLRRKRGIEVFKARGANHVMGEHRMRITPSGIKVFYRPARGAERDDA